MRTINLILLFLTVSAFAFGQCGNQVVNPVQSPTIPAMGQSFQVCSARAGKLTSITVQRLAKVLNDERKGTLKIFKGEFEGANRDGELIYSQSITMAKLEQAEKRHNVTIQLAGGEGSLDYEPNTTYTFYIELNGRILLSAHYGNPYAKGKGFMNVATNPSWDFYFEIGFVEVQSGLIYGKTYKVENTWMNKGAYLDVNGQGCQENYLCVSTTRSDVRKKDSTSDWVILSATGKKAGEPVMDGDLILLKNPWMRGSYLGTRGYSKDFGCPGYLCVSAWQNLDNVKNTTWKISGDVRPQGTIQLIGQWNNASAGHLDINGHHEGGGYNVCTATDGRTTQSSTMWRFLPKK